MSHGCHKCHCPNGCNCELDAEDQALRRELGDLGYEALLDLGIADREREDLERALRQKQNEVDEKYANVRKLIHEIELRGLERCVKYRSRIRRGLSVAFQRIRRP